MWPSTTAQKGSASLDVFPTVETREKQDVGKVLAAWNGPIDFVLYLKCNRGQDSRRSGTCSGSAHFK